MAKSTPDMTEVSPDGRPKASRFDYLSNQSLGFGLGLRIEHFQYVLEHLPTVDWFEINSENFMVAGGKPRHYLRNIRDHYPMVMHGVSMSIGSTDPLDRDYLKQLKVLANEVQPEWVSDHLCWTSLGGINTHDLIPLPYTEEAIDHVVSRVDEVQDFLGRQILMENVSSYVSYNDSRMEEWEFLNEIACRSDCKILLDINNIYVSSRNHGYDPMRYINAIDAQRVQQFHLAGGTDYGDYIIDTHDQDVTDPVWDLYASAVGRFGAVSTMVERDGNIPAFTELFQELEKARNISQQVLQQAV